MKKGRHLSESVGGIKKSTVPNPTLRFSFKFFDASDTEVCPPLFRDGYVHQLMARLKAISSWTVSDFCTHKGKSIRNHPIDWARTSRPSGFQLPEQYDAYVPYQFSVSANEGGRVHGLLIDDTFHIVWLDQNHAVYA
jgi:hypothetical protein